MISGIAERYADGICSSNVTEIAPYSDLLTHLFDLWNKHSDFIISVNKELFVKSGKAHTEYTPTADQIYSFSSDLSDLFTTTSNAASSSGKSITAYMTEMLSVEIPSIAISYRNEATFIALIQLGALASRKINGNWPLLDIDGNMEHLELLANFSIYAMEQLQNAYAPLKNKYFRKDRNKFKTKRLDADRLSLVKDAFAQMVYLFDFKEKILFSSFVRNFIGGKIYNNYYSAQFTDLRDSSMSDFIDYVPENEEDADLYEYLDLHTEEVVDSAEDIVIEKQTEEEAVEQQIRIVQNAYILMRAYDLCKTRKLRANPESSTNIKRSMIIGRLLGLKHQVIAEIFNKKSKETSSDAWCGFLECLDMEGKNGHYADESASRGWMALRDYFLFEAGRLLITDPLVGIEEGLIQQARQEFIELLKKFEVYLVDLDSEIY